MPAGAHPQLHRLRGGVTTHTANDVFDLHQVERSPRLVGGKAGDNKKTRGKADATAHGWALLFVRPHLAAGFESGGELPGRTIRFKLPCKNSESSMFHEIRGTMSL